MYSLERQKEILNLLHKYKTMQVSQICKLLYVSASTIRRDLSTMEKKGLLSRTHGGAMLVEGSAYENPFAFREQKYQEEKNRICSLAASLITNGQTLFLDTSSTVIHLIPYLTKFSSLTVITNNVKAAQLLSSHQNITTILSGGKMRPNSFSVLGIQAKTFIENYYADTAFLSCHSFTPQIGMTESNEEEAELKRVLMDNAQKTILLCDHSKIGKNSFSKVYPAHKIAALITDEPLSAEDTLYLEEKKVSLYISLPK